MNLIYGTVVAMKDISFYLKEEVMNEKQHIAK